MSELRRYCAQLPRVCFGIGQGSTLRYTGAMSPLSASETTASLDTSKNPHPPLETWACHAKALPRTPLRRAGEKLREKQTQLKKANTFFVMY